MNYLSSTYFYDFENENIQNLIEEFKTESLSQKEKATGLYLKVRDGWRYNPYTISIRKEDYRASELVKREEGHCIDKAVILIAGLRALQIPARLRLAKVKNHIAVDKLIEKLGTNELTPHGNVEVYLNEKWIKATPAFNKDLCRICNVAPLEFNGIEDSVFQEYNNSGSQFMEYIEDYGHFEDVPLDFITNNMKENYPIARALFDAGEQVFRI